MLAGAVFEMLGLAAEIGFLDLRTGEIGFDQVVLGQQVGVLQAQALFHAAACWHRSRRRTAMTPVERSASQTARPSS